MNHLKDAVIGVSNFGVRYQAVWRAAAACLVLLLIFLNPVLTPYMKFASLAYVLLLAGLVTRRKPRVHVPLMSSAIALDVAIVLLLEVSRSAVETVMGFKLSGLQQGHIATSLVAVILYIPVVYLGVKRKSGKGTAVSHRLHLRLGLGAFAFRSLGFLLMFSFLWKSA